MLAVNSDEMCTLAAILILVLNLQATSGITTPENFYDIDPNNSAWLDGTVYYGDFNLTNSLKFLGKFMCESSDCTSPQKLVVNKNGVISFKKEQSNTPRRLPTSQWPAQAIIAPLWSWLAYGNGTGAVFYRQDSSNEIKRQAKADVRNNFACDSKFKPTVVLIATWYNMPIDPCTERDNGGKFDHCWCINTYTPEHCECKDYPLADYCECKQSNEADTCQCHDYFDGDYYNDVYCNCLDTDPKEVCDCWAEDAFEYKFLCECEYEGHSDDYCWCLYEDYSRTDYCTCMYIDDRSYDECSCEEEYGVGYCQCLKDYDDQFNSYSFAYEFCDCHMNDNELSSCLCPSSGISQSTEYCSCLDQFQSHFDDNNLGNFDLHEFCLCYANSANATECGCDTCPARRDLLGSSAENEAELTHQRNRRDRIVPVSGDGIVSPWSKEYNTFQAVIIANNKKTYVMFNYASLNIPQYRGNDLRPGVVGFDGDSSGDHFNHKYSYSKRLHKMRKRSNVGIKGRWMYRIDGATVLEPADC